MGASAAGAAGASGASTGAALPPQAKTANKNGMVATTRYDMGELLRLIRAK
jgi:hypothetical protein